MTGKKINKWQFGDFQTPENLAREIVEKLKRDDVVQPDVIIEPSCGKGAFIRASANSYTKPKILGFDINGDYVAEARLSINGCDYLNEIEISQSNFFDINWREMIKKLPGYILVIGNPPWVTSSDLGLLNSKNLPVKSNFQNRRGIEAITGSGNFDISEWMLLSYVSWLSGRPGAMAVLCKYSVARKVLYQVWQDHSISFLSYIHLIDARIYFGAAVDACLFILKSDDGHSQHSVCKVYQGLESRQVLYTISQRDGRVVKDVDAYERWKHLAGQDLHYIWRSGVKHDCSEVMEFKPVDNLLINGLGELVDLEKTYLYPLLKSSDVANERVKENRKVVLITQKYVGEDTSTILSDAPKTWRYLLEHRRYLERRASSIYRNKPDFSVFGIGSYTFGEWKVAISGLYKKLKFIVVGPINSRPVIFDDTVYFLSFNTKEEAEFVHSLISSRPVCEFLESMIFWDEKRPITSDVLRRISLKAVAKELAVEDQYCRWIQLVSKSRKGQLPLGIAERDSSYVI